MNFGPIIIHYNFMMKVNPTIVVSALIALVVFAVASYGVQKILAKPSETDG